VRARKRFGQHFLQPAWVRKVVDAIAPQPGDAFLEIGPGLGALTFALAAHPVTIVAVELDRDLVDGLARSAPANVRIVEGDVLQVDLATLAREAAQMPLNGTGPAGAKLGGRARIVGNLPYNISTPILLRLAALARSGVEVSDASLMLQEEVAARVVSAPGGGDFGPLSIALQQRADTRRLLSLPPGAFRPAPKVRSTLVSLSFRPLDVAIADETLFDRLVRAVFTQRRKTLANALRSFAASQPLEADAAIVAAGVDGRRRPETLSRAEFARLANVFASAKPLPVL
jgi:16S rRNA (adenine1518-N6/adenine1519-N6)-dimethyltransferase